jgi:hypothetical protein
VSLLDEQATETAMPQIRMMALASVNAVFFM